MENKPRWEKKYEELVAKEPVVEKIVKLKEEIANIKTGEIGDFTTKEDYDKAFGEARKNLHNKEKELENYENYEKNKDKIANILAYRKELEKELEKLPAIDRKMKMEKNNKLLEVQEARVDELIAKMNRPGIDPNEYNELQEDLGITQAVIRNLNEQNKILEDDSNDKKREMCERRITKCNFIAANLLKGKNLEDIQIKIEPSSKTFTEAKTEEAKQVETPEESTKPVEEPIKNEEPQEPVKDEKPEEINEAVNEAIEEEAEKNDKDAEYPVNVNEFAERHPRLARIAGFFKNGFSSIKNRIAKLFARKGEVQVETENSTPENTSNVEPEVENKTEQKVEEKIEEKTEQEPKLSDQEMEEVREIIKASRETREAKEPQESREARKTEIKKLREDQLLSYIAEYGKEDGEKAFRDSLRVELEDKKKAAANSYAEKYGGRYEKQDGATHKKDESEQSR